MLFTNTLLLALPLTFALPSPLNQSEGSSRDLTSKLKFRAEHKGFLHRRQLSSSSTGEGSLVKKSPQKRRVVKKACQAPIKSKANVTSSASSASTTSLASATTMSHNTTLLNGGSHSTVGNNDLAVVVTTSKAISSSSTTRASASTTTISTTSTTSSAVVNAGNSIVDSIFPISTKNSWTTVTGRNGAMSIDDALKPLQFGKLPPLTSSPDSSLALQANYPAGTFLYSSSTGHGFSFYTQGLKNSVDVTTASEVLLTYSIYFSDNFDFVKGGKLPGLYGGTSLSEAKSCSGGRQDARDTCFSARLMWRTNGMGEIYNYLPVNAKQPENYCSFPPMSVCNAAYGDSIGRGAFTFPTSQWTTVTQRLKLNSPASQSNGEQEVYVNGKSVLKLTGLQIRTNDDTKIYGIMAQTFFGGSDSSWASPKDQSAWFKDWSLAVVN